jgi:hypothetical protein
MDPIYLRLVDSDEIIAVSLRIEIENLLDRFCLSHIVLVKIQGLKNGEPFRCVRAIRAGMTGIVNLSDYQEIHLPTRELWATIEH